MGNGRTDEMKRESSDDGDPVVAEYARQARAYDERWSFYIHATVQETLRRTPIKPGQRVLDVGCGTGALLKAMTRVQPDARLTGVDPTQEMLSLARQGLPGRVTLKRGRAESLPFENESFDTVVSCNMFHYLRDPERALAETRRVLKLGGNLVITDWCHDYLACKLCHAYLSIFDPAHFTVYGTADCRKLLHQSEFHDVEVNRYKINWIWGMMTVKGVKYIDS